MKGLFLSANGQRRLLFCSQTWHISVEQRDCEVVVCLQRYAGFLEEWSSVEQEVEEMGEAAPWLPGQEGKCESVSRLLLVLFLSVLRSSLSVCVSLPLASPSSPCHRPLLYQKPQGIQDRREPSLCGVPGRGPLLWVKQ